MRTRTELEGMTVVQLRAELETKYEYKGISRAPKAVLVDLVMDEEAKIALLESETSTTTKAKSVRPEMSMERIQEAEDLLEVCCLKDTKTAKIMTLHLGGFKVSEIAQLLGVRYQMVYNIINK